MNYTAIITFKSGNILELYIMERTPESARESTEEYLTRHGFNPWKKIEIL